ncbi:5'-3' exonuclease PLD3-like isoform X1 [Haliotis rufescens]|uniref:5'-3' exonuclease PLD3-like isoform X1 n=1 Tax=Haliotis rufescens TaxID=6454 RepID=UPI00201F436B|nr:5'-3' exonuclease PLD3-like isoform X1 [Haliotis rufescens]
MGPRNLRQGTMSVQQETAPLIASKPGRNTTYPGKDSKCRPAKICLIFILALLLLASIVAGLIITYAWFEHDVNHVCHDQCRIQLVESIPENLTFPANETVHLPTAEALMELILSANETIEIASYYWTLRTNDVPDHDNSSRVGQLLFNTLMKIGKEQKVKIKIVQNIADKSQPQHDSEYLKEYAHAEVRNLNVTRLVGAGILHTKMWLIDRKSYYVGSANTDWRSLTQVKEMGVLVQNCSCLATDIGKIFDAYWYLAQDQVTIPGTWPASYNTDINGQTPEVVSYNGGNDTQALVYMSSSPPQFCPEGRTVDIEAIIAVIRAARRFVYVAVMDYLPMIAYSTPRKFWPIIDDELRYAAINRGVTVRMLGSKWAHTDEDMPTFLRSLLTVSDVCCPHIKLEVKMFEVPATPAQAKIPYARVNHNKFMVTDQHAYIGTSNWYGDYFKYTAGIGFVLTPSNSSSRDMGDIRQQLEDVFLRDWNSQYSKPLEGVAPKNCSDPRC